MNIINKKVIDLVPYERNAKKHDSKQINNVAESIKQYGFVQPVVIDKNNVIVIGHCRTLAAKKLGIEEVPCVCVDDLTEAQVKALRIIDNKTNESDWDNDLLFSELEMLDLTGFTFDDFPQETISTELEEVDPAEIDEENTIAKYGDIWQLGEHRLMCGDSTDASQVAKLMNYEEADMVVTDPPYNVGYTGGIGVNREEILNDNMDDNSFEMFLTYAFTAFKESLKNGGAFYIWYADTDKHPFEKAISSCELKIRQVLIWSKHKFPLGMSDYQRKHEACLYGWKDGAAHYFIKDRTMSTVIEDDFDIDNLSKQELKDLLKQYIDNTEFTVIEECKPSKSEIHPTMKPIKLFGRLIKNSSRIGEKVLDPFAGSGTTIIACEQLNRKAYCMELSPKYCDAIIKRWEDYTGMKAEKVN